MQDTAKALEEALARNLVKAERENATVYLQRILLAGELPAVAGALLVKPIAPHLDASGEGLFTSVIPDSRFGLFVMVARSSHARKHPSCIWLLLCIPVCIVNFSRPCAHINHIDCSGCMNVCDFGR